MPCEWFKSNFYGLPLAEHIPLKQGLRPSSFVLNTLFIILAEHIPLKQGLRHGKS